MTHLLDSLVQWHDADKTWCERILFIDASGDNVACIRIELDSKNQDKMSRPFWRSKTDLEQALAKAEARVLEKDPFLRPPMDPKKLSKKMKKRWAKNCKAIETIIDDPQKQFGTPAQRRGSVSEAARASGLSRKHIYRLLWKYWKGGQTPQCVLINYKKCGGKKRRFLGGKKRGPRSAREIQENRRIGLVITNTDKPRILRGIDKYCNNPKERTRKQSLDLLLREQFSSGGEVVNGVWVPTLKSEDELLSERQLKYLQENNRDPEREGKGRDGEKGFALTGRAITGNTETQLSGPGALAQMDSTIEPRPIEMLRWGRQYAADDASSMADSIPAPAPAPHEAAPDNIIPMNPSQAPSAEPAPSEAPRAVESEFTRKLRAKLNRHTEESRQQ
jgi:hypothetical protein